MLGLNERQVLPGTGAGRPIARSHGDVIRIQLLVSNLCGLKLTKALPLLGCANTKENSAKS